MDGLAVNLFSPGQVACWLKLQPSASRSSTACMVLTGGGRDGKEMDWSLSIPVVRGQFAPELVRHFQGGINPVMTQGCDQLAIAGVFVGLGNIGVRTGLVGCRTSSSR